MKTKTSLKFGEKQEVTFNIMPLNGQGVDLPLNRGSSSVVDRAKQSYGKKNSV